MFGKSKFLDMALAFNVGVAYIKCMPAPNLSAADRDFFKTLAEVVFGNPFSPIRDQLIVRLAPGATPGDLTSDPEALARVVRPQLEPWMRDGGAALRRLGAEDRAMFEPALLYVGYHRCLKQLDALIESQVAEGAKPQRVDFADPIIEELVAGGFSEARAVRFFAFYFQLRRAFYFINRDLAGECESMQRLRESLWNNIFSHDMRGYEAALWNRMEHFSTLLLGDTGTGKGSAAAAIGRSEFIPYLPAERRFAANFTETFIAINLSQFPETLIESELFGHRKGAFTGAVEGHEGVFARCSSHGALFLDEIGEVSIPVQIKLLQVLQERAFTALGSHEKKRFAGRVIAATNQDLGQKRRDGNFRDDFYYRLCSDVIRMPTLQQRIAESQAELYHLVKLLVARITGVEGSELVMLVMQAFEKELPHGYTWPGNVRELEQAVRRVLLTGRYVAEATPAGSEEETLLARMRSDSLSADELLGRYSKMLYKRSGKYTEVATHMGLDVRTVKKYVES